MRISEMVLNIESQYECNAGQDQHTWIRVATASHTRVNLRINAGQSYSSPLCPVHNLTLDNAVLSSD